MNCGTETGESAGDKIMRRHKVCAEKAPVLATALSFLDPRRKPTVFEMNKAEREMYDMAEKCSDKVWSVWKFFHCRSCLDWGTDPSIVCAGQMGFPLPDQVLDPTMVQPAWWKDFRRFIDNHVSRARGRAIYDIGKKMQSKSFGLRNVDGKMSAG